MKAVLCDRCKRIVAPVLPRGLIDFGVEGQAPAQADLCPECLADFRRWLESPHTHEMKP